MPDTDALRRAVDELTLRDHFASLAFAALVGARLNAGPTTMAETARHCYDWAEQMLDERTRRAEADVAARD